MQCPNCGKSNKVVINAKDYCADCGRPHAEQANNAPTSIPDTKPAPKSVNNSSNLLDLSQRLQAKSQGSPRAVQPAQGLHGVSQAGAQNAAQSQPATKKNIGGLRPATRNLRISKFPPGLKEISPTERQEEAEPAPPVTLTPHQSYKVNPKTARADLEAAIALHHARHEPRQAPLTQDHQPVPVPEKPARKWRKLLTALPSLFQQRPRLASASAIVLSVVILAGYVAYLNYPSIALKVAANRAGIDAQLPRYRPPGYAFQGPVNYTSGQVTIRFAANSDAGFVTLTQRQTDWDSASLRENLVSRKSSNYLTFQENGLTIYVYNGSNAAWVNQGTLYTIEGNNFLNSDQIIRMATSL